MKVSLFIIFAIAAFGGSTLIAYYLPQLSLLLILLWDGYLFVTIVVLYQRMDKHELYRAAFEKLQSLENQPPEKEPQDNGN